MQVYCIWLLGAHLGYEHMLEVDWKAKCLLKANRDELRVIETS